MSGYKNLAVNTALFAANAVATRLMTFLLVPLYTYYMSAGEYGITDMSLTVISLVTPLATLAVADAAVRFIIEDDSRKSEYAFIGFVVTLLSILIVAMLTPALDLDVFGGLGKHKVFFLFAYSSSAFLQLCSEVARGMGEIKLIPICSGISSMITGVSAFVLIGGCGMTVAGYFISVSVEPLVATCVYLTVGRIGARVLEGMRKVFAKDDIAKQIKELCVPMLRYALPLIPNSLFWWVGTSINRFFITGMIGIAASGLFAAAGKIPGLLNTAYSVFLQAWQLSAFQESGKEGLDRFFSSVFRVLQAFISVLCSLISFLAPWVSMLFLQGEFYEAWPMMSVLLIANLMNVFNSFFGTVYTTTMHTSYIMKTTIVGAASCIALTPALIPVLGISGACVASAVSQALVFVVRAIDSRKYIHIEVGWPTLIATLAALAMQSAVAVLQPSCWQLMSGACLVAIIVMQGLGLMRFVRHSGAWRKIGRR